jgi:conjugative relaxase-like TrwC/TraI family protein
MLTRYTVTNAYAAKKYFETSDYYSEGQETVGKWYGDLAKQFGLSGTVDKASFDRLCDNYDPRPRKDKAGNEYFEPLTLRTNAERRVGDDFTFSGPKSFSVVEGLASEDIRRAMRQAFDEAVEETLVEDIEPDMQARVRKDGADENRTTGNMLAAGYDHGTARPKDDDTPPDPHRHKHVFVFNATHDPVEDCIKAAEMGNIVRDRPYYQAAFFARLANKLEAQGFVIDRREGGKWELAGVPQSVIDKFSKRTDEIEDEAARKGITDPGQKAELGAKTRSRKQKELTPAELRKAWDAQLTDGERDALAAVWRKEVAPGREVTAAEAVRFGIDHLSEQLSVFPERELKRVALLNGLGSVTPDAIDAELPRQGVIVRDIGGRHMTTTEALQREEQAIIGFAAGGRGTVRPVGVADGLDRALAGGKSLNDEQWEVTCGLLNSENRVELFQGPAGAGKSYSLEKYDQGMRMAGQTVTYLGTTTGSVERLEEDGFTVNTVARFLLDTKMQAAAEGGRVVIDESSLLGHKEAFKLFMLAEKLDLKLILVGDPMQHGSVGRGALMQILKDYGGVQPFRLTEIMRQEDPEYRAAAKLLSEGETLAGFDAIDRLGWVQEMADEDRYRHIGADYVQALKDKKTVLVISPTHREAGLITQEIRSQLRDAGKLGGEEIEFTRLVAANASEAERSQATTYRPGDVIQFHQNAKGFTKGDRLTVIDPATVPLSEAAKFSLYRPEKISLAAGDVIRFTGTVKTLDDEHKLRNGLTKTVAEITPGGNIRLDNGWVVAADAGHFRHGFVETSFGSQGRTVQRVIVGMSSASLPATNQEQMYVSASRAKERMTLYTDDKAAVRDGVQRSSQKLAALDLLTPQPKAAVRVRKHMERRRRATFIRRVRAAHPAPPRQPDRQPERQVSHGR